MFMNKLQQQVQKALKENSVNLSREELVLGIYDELSGVTRAIVNKGDVSAKSLGEIGTLLLQICNEEGLDFEEVVGEYLNS